MHTEEEAKTKWCPQIVDADSLMSGEQSGDCIGSRCMAWRWLGSKGPEQQGYCGLAGRP